MKLEDERDLAQPEFDWLGFAVLLVGINVSIYLLSSFYFLIPGCLLGIVVFIRHYDWKNVLTALLITFTLLHPIRILFDWWFNPIPYASLTVICLIVMIRFIQRHSWKNDIFALIVVCTLLSVGETLGSASEIGQCYVEDFRNTYYFYCTPTGRGYQQIESLPIGMSGWCYYCFWY